MEVETQNAGKPSSPHANSLSDPQYTQSAIGDAKTMKWCQPDVDPRNPQDAQTSTGDTQTVKWS